MASWFIDQRSKGQEWIISITIANKEVALMQMWVKSTHWLLLKSQKIPTKHLINRKGDIGIFWFQHASQEGTVLNRLNNKYISEKAVEEKRIVSIENIWLVQDLKKSSPKWIVQYIMWKVCNNLIFSSCSILKKVLSLLKNTDVINVLRKFVFGEKLLILKYKNYTK